MAARTILTDDITPTIELPDGATSTRITLTDGRDSFDVEIDLGDENFRKLMTAVRKYRDNGRAVIAPTPVVKVAKDSASDGPVIRAWAQANPSLLPDGVKVPADRGALSKEVIAAYDAHKSSTDNVNGLNDDGSFADTDADPEAAQG